MLLSIRHQEPFFENHLNWTEKFTIGIVCSVASLICIIIFGIACICCGSDYNFFKSWTSHNRYRRNFTGFNNDSQNEITIFPPPGFQRNDYLSNSDVYFERLPDISSRLRLENYPDITKDWFGESNGKISRSHLQYVQQLGSGWFGQIFLGHGSGLRSVFLGKQVPVVVKSLREDASVEEQCLFLKEIRPYKVLKHTNVLRVLGHCLEKHPFLVVLQFCSKGDLKSVLQKDKTLSDGSLLKMAKDVAAGLAYMHEHNFVHTDLAARNCLVEEDLTVKIGDYGVSIDTGNYKDEYYLAENVALPIRWCSPETLKCTEITIETIPLTKEANVWTLGVVMWEIMSRGELPYADLDEDGVIQRVIIDGTRRLRAPQSQSLHLNKLDSLLKCCWLSSHQRPPTLYMDVLLTHLCSCFTDHDVSSVNDFEHRWDQLRSEHHPGSQAYNIPMRSPLKMKFESDFCPETQPHDQTDDLEAHVVAKFSSPIPSWLGMEPNQTMDSLTEQITNAIQKLDEALAEDIPGEEPAKITKSVTFQLEDNLFTPEGLLSHPLSDREDENLSLRLEQGDFSELVRMKSQSVQDLMRLTVVDDGSDSDKTSQPASLISDCNLLTEKTFSSENDITEAVRDANFMLELERLQNCSIISEENSEKTPSFISCETTSVASESRTSGRGRKEISAFLGVKNPSSDEGKDEVILFDKTSTPKLEENCSLQESPDCIISSRETIKCDLLPDILADSANAICSSLSDDCEDDSSSAAQSDILESYAKSNIKFEVLTELPNGNAKVSSKGDVKILNSMENRFIVKDAYSEDSDLPQEGGHYPINSKAVTFGALESYSLDYLHPVKSAVVDRCNEAQSNDSDNGHHVMEDDTDSDHVMKDITSHFFVNTADGMKSGSELNCTVKAKVYDRFDSWTSSLNDSKDLTLDRDNYITKSNASAHHSYTQNCDSSEIRESGAVESRINDSESDEFWKRQMEAWNEAAAETRELLIQASSQELIDDDFEDTRSNPNTPGSSTKSPSSSTDKLDTDDEGTYVSYDTADDDEALHYSPEDLNILRSKLCLMIGDIGESCLNDENEAANDLVYINYREPRNTLSPIKEEHSEGHDNDNELNFNASDQDSSSIEFMESNYSSNDVDKVTGLGSGGGEIEEGEEATKDSLIFEDLDSCNNKVIVGLITHEENCDDLLFVDTETHQVTLVDSGKPPSTFAFLFNKKERNEELLPPSGVMMNFDTEDDVATESLPYYTSSHNDAPSLRPVEKKLPNYHNYFTSGFSSLPCPSLSQDGNISYDSYEQASLPYDVNFPIENDALDVNTSSTNDSTMPHSYHGLQNGSSLNSEKDLKCTLVDNPTKITLQETFDDKKLEGYSAEKPEETREFVTLSFLGNLYNAQMSESVDENEFPTLRETSGNFYSRSQNDDESDSDIDENLPEEPIEQGNIGETPLRTPGHLADIVWRPEEQYSPDWEADILSDSDGGSSSTSQEFIWQASGSMNIFETEMSCLEHFLGEDGLEMESSVETAKDDVPQKDHSEDESESGEEEFTPSTWNKQLTPQRSLLKSPETNASEKKCVHWKQQRHHRVYEYPPEPQSWHAEIPIQNSRPVWEPHSLDFVPLSDLGLGEDGTRGLGRCSFTPCDFFPRSDLPFITLSGNDCLYVENYDLQDNIDTLNRNSDEGQVNTDTLNRNSDEWQDNTNTLNRNSDEGQDNTDTLNRNSDVGQDNTDALNRNSDEGRDNTDTLSRNSDEGQDNTDTLSRNSDEERNNTEALNRNSDEGQDNTEALHRNSEVKHDTSETSKLSREKLRLDLPLLCLTDGNDNLQVSAINEALSPN